MAFPPRFELGTVSFEDYCANPLRHGKKLVSPEGVEPPTERVEAFCSNPLSYGDILAEGGGVEPTRPIKARQFSRLFQSPV